MVVVGAGGGGGALAAVFWSSMGACESCSRRGEGYGCVVKSLHFISFKLNNLKLQAGARLR